ncbi:hypothetical protein FRC03_003203 [Tulasnella sp. 419]|nr:hypothetical protein FRC03_003203 [Tulasnella sp. 419]
MASDGRKLRRANPNTIQSKVLVGYHGWFSCPGDGQPPQPGHHGWENWFNSPIPSGGHPTFDLYPDVSVYPPAELYTASGLTLPSSTSEPARLFSSRSRGTVQNHFHLMARHGIDGVFVIRKATELEITGNQNSPQAGITRIRDEVLDRIREAAEQQDRVWAIMYDVSGIPNQWLPHVLRTDWGHLLRDKSIVDSPNYLREGGKPVIGISGLGLKDAGHNPGLLTTILRHFRMVTPNGAYIVAGVSTNWRTPEQGDQDANPDFMKLWKEMDAILPLSVGKYQDEYSTDSFAVEVVREDMKEIKRWNMEWNGEKKIEYIPTAFPGLSRYNLTAGHSPLNEIPRQSGRFLWRQIYHYQREGARTIFIASLDNFGDGTALLPSVPLSRLLPNEFRFLSLDADGDTSLSPDWYLRICGMAAEAMRGEKMIVTDAMPKKEIDDYWGMRPRYEESVNDSGASESGAAGGSSSAADSYAATSSADAGGSSSSGAVPGPIRTMTMDFEGLGPAPPPYSLEADEPTRSATTSDPAPSQQPAREETMTLVSSPTRQTEPLPAQPEPQPQGPQRVGTGMSTVGPLPQAPVPNNAPDTSFYHASVARHQSAMASSGMDQRQPRSETRQYTSPAPPGGFPAQQNPIRQDTGQRPFSAGQDSRGPSPLRNTQGYPQNPGTQGFQMPPGGQPANQGGMPNLEGLSLHGRPPSAPASSPPLPGNEPRPWNRNSRPTSPARYGNQGPGWSPSIEPGQIFPAAYNPGTTGPLPSPPISPPSSYPHSQVPSRQNSSNVPPFRPPGDPFAQGPPGGPMGYGPIGGGPIGGGPFHQSPTSPIQDAGGFVLPEQTGPAVGGFSAPGLNRASSARVNAPAQPPPMHPQRPGAPPRRTSNSAGSTEPLMPPPSRTGTVDSLAQSSGPRLPGPPLPSGNVQGPSSYPIGPTAMGFPGGPSSYGPSPNTTPSGPPNAPQPAQPQSSSGSQQSMSTAPHSYPNHLNQQPNHPGDGPGVPGGPGGLGGLGGPGAPSPPSVQPSSSQYPPAPSHSYNPPSFPPSSWHVPHAQGGFGHGMHNLFHHGHHGGPGPSSPPQQPSYSQYPGSSNAGPQVAGLAYPQAGPSTSSYPQMPPNQPVGSPALPPRPPPNMNQPPAAMPLPATIMDPARQYLDKFAGEDRRRQVEKGLGSAVQTGTKLWNKFSGGKN